MAGKGGGMAADVEVLGEQRDPRRFRARWVLQGTVELVSAAHLGGTPEDGGVDAPVLRDRIERKPLLTGTSLGGALRAYLADLLGGYATGQAGEPEQVACLFGLPRGAEHGTQSPLIVFDALGELPGKRTEIRDGVAIDPATGTAEEHKKFDLEVLPPGTAFTVRTDLLVPDTCGEQGERELLGLLAAALAGLAPGGITVGARGARGLGAVQAREWRAHRFDLTSARGWLAWLTSDHEQPLPAAIPPATSPDKALQHAGGRPEPLPADRRRRVVAEVTLTFRGGLLVRSPASTPDAPDVAHLTSAGSPVLPGTSLAGALRTRLLRIARVVRARHGDAERWVTDLLGTRLAGGGTRLDAASSLQPSRLRVSESPLQDGRRVRASRVRIDRFTQGVVQGALFDEEVQDGGTVTVRMELRDPRDGEVGLLLLGLKDLIDGDLPLGGTVAAGRGVATGRARVRLADGTVLELAAGGAGDPASVQHADRLVQAFHQAEVRR